MCACNNEIQFSSFDEREGFFTRLLGCCFSLQSNPPMIAQRRPVSGLHTLQGRQPHVELQNCGHWQVPARARHIQQKRMLQRTPPWFPGQPVEVPGMWWPAVGGMCCVRECVCAVSV